LEGEDRENGVKPISEEIMAQIPQICLTPIYGFNESISHKQNTTDKQTRMPRHIIVKLMETKKRDKHITIQRIMTHYT
jgi:hypothetical protein